MPSKQSADKILNKIKKLTKTPIVAIGGINFDNSKKAIEAGANILVSGTTIFKINHTMCLT